MAVDLGKQYGPLPLGAWVAVVGGGLGIAWYTRSRSGGGTQIVEDTSSVGGVGTGGVSTWIQNTPPDDTVQQKPTTNEEWARAAINYLIAQGYDPSLADTAVRKYLESTQLSLSERAMITIALAKLGAPPVPLPAPPDLPTVPPPAPTPTPTPAPAPAPVTVPPPNTGRWVTVVKWPSPSPFDTMWSISEWAYGAGYLYPRIYNANRRGVLRPDGTYGFMYRPDLIHPGERLYIP